MGTDAASAASAASWRMQSIVRDSDSESDDEYFDCQGKKKYCTVFVKFCCCFLYHSFSSNITLVQLSN